MELKKYRVSDLISEIAMGPFGSNIKKDCFIESGIPVLNGSNLGDIFLVEDSFNYVSEEKADSLKKANAHRGDIIITHRGTLGQISYIPMDSIYERYVISQSQFRVKCNDLVNPCFLVYYFHTPIGQSKLLSNASQVGVPSLARPTTTFQQIDIEIPPIEEQEKIVSILLSFRRAIKVNDRINNNLRNEAMSLFMEFMKNNIEL